MLMDIWASIGEFVGENFGIVWFVGMILVIVFEVAQFIINSSLEEEIIDLTERVEDLEKLCGMISELEGRSEDSEKMDGSEEE